MAIFDNELIDNVTDRSTKPLSSTIESPTIKDLSKSVSGFGSYGNESINETGLSIDELSNINVSSQSTVDSPFQSILKSELIQNKRFPLYERGKDLENIAGLGQSWTDRLANSTVKFAATTLGTFTQGFATIPNTIQAIKDGNIDALSGPPDGFEASIDTWLKNLEDNFPNYYTKYEREHPFRTMIPFTTGSANFWGDKVIKNLGFTAGAIANAVVTDLAVGVATGGIGEIPLVASQIGKASLYLNKIFSGVNRLDEALNIATNLGKAKEQIMNIQRLGQIAETVKLVNGSRYAISIYGSARTEAAIEARDSYNKVREELIEQYKLQNVNQEPTGSDLDKINSHAEDAMNTRFGVNMALLTVSNAVQFGNLFKSFNKTNKAVGATLGKVGLKEGSMDIFERKGAETVTGKLWESVKPSLKNVFTEGVYEEGGQFATERGVYDYYTRKYKSPNNKETWDDLNELVTSTLKGLKDQFGSTEGIENMIVGGITAMIAGGISNKIQSVQGADENSRTQATINILNQYGLTGTLANQYSDTLNNASIAKEMNEAVISKDAYKYKNLKDDMFFNFVYSRLPNNLHDTTVEQLSMLKDLPKEEFERTFGMDLNEASVSTVGGYVDLLIDEANHIKKVYDSVDSTFKNPFVQIVNPQTPEQALETQKFNTFNEWKNNLVYYGTVSRGVNRRLDEIQLSLSNINTGLTNDLVATLANTESLKELSRQYEEEANRLNKNITEYTAAKDKKAIKDNIKTFRTFSEKINRAIAGTYDIKFFNDLLNFELNLHDPKKDKIIGTESSAEIFNSGVDINRLNSRKRLASEQFDALSSEEGFNKFFSQEEKIPTPSEKVEKPEVPVAPEIVTRAGVKEPIQVGREYLSYDDSTAIIRKTADDRWEVISPRNESSFFSSEEAAKSAKTEIDEGFANIKKVKVLEVNPDNTIKIEDVNGDIYNISPDRLIGYERVITEQEKLQKFKEELDKDQADIETSSGTTSTNTLEQDISFATPEEFKKATDILFSSTTSASEDWEAGTLKPHHLRAIEFLNNVKDFVDKDRIKIILVTKNQEKSLGLEGLTALSMEGSGQDTNKYTDVNEGFVAAVYVHQEDDGLYFLDKKGKNSVKVGEKADLNKVVFSTMPTTHVTWKDGKTPRYRDGEREEAINQSKRWEAKRKQLFNLPEGKYEAYSFVVSRGIPNITDQFARYPVGDNLVPEELISTYEGLVKVPVSNTIFHQGQLIKFPNGRPVLHYGDTLQFLSNDKFTKKQVDSIFETLKALSKDIRNQLEAGARPRLNRKYTKFLQGVLFYKKGTNIAPNQFFIDTNTMDVRFGEKRWDLTRIADFETEIKEKLSDTYNSVNNLKLTKAFAEPFTELYFDGTELKEREWVNYQTYLLSSSYPDGSKRADNDLPLSTSVTPPTEAVPYNFKQKYATLVGVEYPQIELPKVTKEKKIETPKAGEYTIDGVTENTYTLKSGPVQFTASSDDKGNFSVTVKSNETTQKIAANEASMKTVVDALKAAKIFDATKENEALVLDFVANRIVADLKTKKPTDLFEKLGGQKRLDEVEEEIRKENQKLDNTTPPPNSEYRRVGSDVERISPAEIELFKEWHSKNTPNIPYEILENVLVTHDGEKAWGAFENNVAKFYKSAARGTEYHEIFEGIWKSFLSNDEQLAILNEFKTKAGSFTDRQSGKKIKFDEATDLQAKERIADDFADFRLGKLPARSLGERILRFFRAILEFFRQFVQKPSLKEQLFKAIDTGKFKDATPVAVDSPFSEYRRVEGLSEQQTNELVEDITARVFQIVFSTNVSLFNPEKLTAPDIFGRIKASYEAEGKLEIIGEKAWGQLLQRTREFLRSFRIEFDEADIISINNEEQDRLLYAPEPFSTDWKKSSPFPIKLLVGTLTETVAENQENSSNLNLPQQKLSSVNGYKLFNFSRAFATLMDKLGNTTAVQDVVDKLVTLSKNDSNYVRLFTRLGGARNPAFIDFNKFDKDDWRLFVNFYQTFTKQKPEAHIQYMSNGEVYTSAANLFTSVKQVKKSWLENIKGLSKDKESIIVYDRGEKAYQVKDLSNIQIRTPQMMIDFLAKIGIDFPMEAYLRLKADNGENRRFAEAVAAIYKYLGSNKNIASVTGKTLGVNSQLTALADLLVRVTNPNQDLSYFGIEQKRRQMFSDNNAASLFENEFNSIETLDQLIEARPELNDIFSKNSQVLKRGGLFFDKNGKRIKKIKIGYIQGTENVDSGRSYTTASLSKGARFTQELNQNLNGNYYILVPADSSTEWTISLGNNISFESVDTGDAWNSIYGIFRGYLKDDINLALSNRNYLRNTAPRAKELRFFKDILPKDLVAKANNLILNEATDEQVVAFIEENTAEINAAVKDFIQKDVDNLLGILKNNNQLTQISETAFMYPNLDDNFTKSENLDKYNLSIDDINKLLTFAQVNYIISNIELHKVLFGDPYQFAIKSNQLDETKRIKSYLSPRRTTFDSPEFNSFLNQTLNTVSGIPLTENDPGYHLHKSYVSTVTFNDVNIVGSLHKINPAYEKTNEADAASWIMDAAYREVKLKNGQWSDEAENWHQWQMAYTRQHMPGYKYSSDKLKQHDIKLLSSPAPKYTIEVLKPIVSGVKYGRNTIDSVLDKFSQMPIYYSMVEGTNLEKLYTKMFNEKVGYGIVISGRKEGAEKLHELYTDDGKFNEEPFNNRIDIPWKIYGIQVENSYDSPKEQTRGSQLTKLSSLDLFDNGKASDEAKKEYKRNQKILDMMHRNGYKTLLSRLGIEDLDGTFRLVDNVSVSQTLEREMLRREVSENVKDVVQLDENGEFRIPFEASSAYIQIKDILYSIVDKSIIAPKMSGASHVQVPATLWESSKEGRKMIQVNGKKVFTDTALKFYTKEEPYMEVLLPCWFRNKLNKGRFRTDEEILSYLNRTEEGRSILKGIGFRIPTQSMSSIENIRVKGFLPAYMGATVVVPSEITTKAGSDFDIDKLNMYLKAVYTDENGNIKLVKYKGSEEETKEFYGTIFDRKLEKKKVTTSEILEALQLVHQGREYVEQYDTKGLVNKYGEVLNAIITESDNINDKEEQLLRKIEQYGDENIQEGLRQEYVNEMYKRSLDNEYYDSLEKLLTLPENFERLISPVDDAGLKKLSDRLDTLRNEDEETIKNRLLSRGYMSSLRHAFVLGKKWVGIGAVNITGHSLTQKAEVFIDPDKFALIPSFDRKFLGDGSVVLPHNEIDGKISMSAVKTYNGKQYISDRLSGYITSFVDVAKDPYILKIIRSNLAVGTFMFLERIGAGENTIFFMNQPIIQKYLDYLDSINASGLFNKKNIEYITDQFITSDALRENAKISIPALELNIKRYSEKGKFDSLEDNAVQHKILEEFLKYAKMAEYSFKLTQASNYDTTKFRSSDTLFRKQTRTEEARESNIFSSVDKILDNSFIGEQSVLLAYSSEAMGEILKLDKYDFRDYINPVIKPYARNQYLSNDKYDRITNKILTSFIDFVAQTKSPLNTEIKSLLISAGTAVADQLAVAKKEHPEIRLLKELDIVSGGRVEGARSIKLRANIKTAYDENLYTEMFRELKASLPRLYNDIVKLSILQGTYQSAISIANVIPLEDRSAILAPIISTLNADDSLLAFSQGAFQRNNWKDEDVFHKFAPKFLSQEVSVAVDKYGNEIYQYISPSFPNIKNLNIKASDRKILLLSEIYNAFDAQYDFIVIPRVVEDPKTGERVSMVTGRTVTGAAIRSAITRGDMSFKDVYGYQKVKYADGSPVLNYDRKGNASYVYKLINLWGDGQYAAEYYQDFRPSVLDNGTVKISQEIPDADIISHFSPKVEEKIVSLQEITPMENPQYPNKPEFNKLPAKATTPTFTYAGIGSRETPKEIQDQMAQLAIELESKGYTLNTGDAEGADKAFRQNAQKKEVFIAKDANDRTRSIAKEIHPNPFALKTDYVLNLMARNTNQVFGRDLNTPVDFVLTWTPDGLTDFRNRSLQSGGTGQAIDMASRKNIPVINMKNPTWRQQLSEVLQKSVLSEESNESIPKCE